MRTVFPFVIDSSLLEPLYALSKIGYGNHPSLKNAWDALNAHRDESGLYILDWYPQSYFTPGRKNEPSEWVTLYTMLAKKYRDERGGV